MNFQDMVMRLESYWAEYGCLIARSYNSEVGAGTYNPATFLRVLGPEPWKVAYLEPSKRPRDGRYGRNPHRSQQFLQYQVILKPSPDRVQEIYLDSLKAVGVRLGDHDIRFIEDDWEQPTLGAWGLGWQVWLDGLEITQFTYFQQVGGLDLETIPVELTYGLERIALIVQGKARFSELQWSNDLSWAEMCERTEEEFSRYNFQEADIRLHRLLFDEYEKEVERLLSLGLVSPAYDHVIKASHMFNMLEARGAISVAERTNYIARARRLARQAALAYLEQRKSLGFPLLSR
jgi:glycyl-tRNA synthetase alpha chain